MSIRLQVNLDAFQRMIGVGSRRIAAGDITTSGPKGVANRYRKPDDDQHRDYERDPCVEWNLQEL